MIRSLLMPNFIRNIFAVLLAILAAAIIGFSIITLGHSIVPPPDGMDTNDFESIKSNFYLMELKHFLFPLIGHGLATFIASYLVSRFAKTHQLWLAIGIGMVFMLASIALSLRIGYFHWIGIIEIAQYIPLSFLGYKVWKRSKSSSEFPV